MSGITTKLQVEQRRLEHQGKKQAHQVSEDFKTGMDAAVNYGGANNVGKKAC
ncbi:Chromosome replication initiation protein dnaD [Streptococcus sp. HSISS2]|nr:Chromosome replication initiation protein dnaD [Streptococcus sp. HSISS2]